MKIRLLVLCLGLSAALGATVQAGELNAVLDWAQRVELSTPVSGVIDKVAVDVGDRVAKGAVLLRLDPRTFAVELRKARAQVAALKDARAEAEREVQRAQELFDRTVMSELEREQVRLSFVRADADYKVAEAQLANARLQQGYSVIRAPFPALVVQRYAQPGQTVVSELQAKPLVVVVHAESLMARAQAELQQVQDLRAGQQVQVKVGEQTYDGRVEVLGLEPIDGAATPPRYEVVVRFKVAPDHGWRKGQPALILIP